MEMPAGGHSPDKAWWWSGFAWEPAWSPDGAWWFDGVTWQAAFTAQPTPVSRSRRGLTRAEIIVSALWFVLWLLAFSWTLVEVPKGQAEGSTLSKTALTFGIVLMGMVLLGTVASAIWLANRGRWWVLGLLAAYVSCLFFAWYLAAMLSVSVPPEQPDTQDDLAAVGLVFLAIPTAIVVVVLVSLGTGIGATVRRIRLRRSTWAHIA